MLFFILWSPLTGILMLLVYWMAIFVLPAILWLFMLGGYTIDRATRQSGAYALTLYVMGALFCEPIFNALLIWMRVATAWRFPEQQNAIQLTITMAFVVLPAIGLFIRERIYRRALLQLLGLGVLRWLLVISALTWLQSEWTVATLLLLFISLVLAMGLLWLTVGWGHQTVHGVLAAPSPTPSGTVLR